MLCAVCGALNARYPTDAFDHHASHTPQPLRVLHVDSRGFKREVELLDGKSDAILSVTGVANPVAISICLHRVGNHRAVVARIAHAIAVDVFHRERVALISYSVAIAVNLRRVGNVRTVVQAAENPVDFAVVAGEPVRVLVKRAPCYHHEVGAGASSSQERHETTNVLRHCCSFSKLTIDCLEILNFYLCNVGGGTVGWSVVSSGS